MMMREQAGRDNEAVQVDMRRQYVNRDDEEVSRNEDTLDRYRDEEAVQVEMRSQQVDRDDEAVDRQG